MFFRSRKKKDAKKMIRCNTYRFLSGALGKLSFEIFATLLFLKNLVEINKDFLK